MPDIKHRMIETNGIRLHVAEQGEGPLVILCHGFPEWSCVRGLDTSATSRVRGDFRICKGDVQPLPANDYSR